MNQLKVSTSSLGDAADAVKKVETALDDAWLDTEVLAFMVGHEGLATQIRSFSTSWDKRRADLTEQLKTLGDNLRSGAETFTAADQGLANALTGEQA